MGQKCLSFFAKSSPEQISFSLLNSQARTTNDTHYTYFLGIYQLEASLSRIYQDSLKEEGSTALNQATKDELRVHRSGLSDYLKDYEQGEVKKVWENDAKRLIAKISQEGGAWEMLKIQIQSADFIKDVDLLDIQIESIPLFKKQKDEMAKKQKEKGFTFTLYALSKSVYCELMYPVCHNQKQQLKMTTSPVHSTLTIDIDDIFPQGILLSTLPFFCQQRQYGSVSVRLQHFDLKEAKNRLNYLKLLEHQLGQMIEGQLRVSSIRDSHSELMSADRDSHLTAGSYYNHQ